MRSGCNNFNYFPKNKQTKIGKFCAVYTYAYALSGGLPPLATLLRATLCSEFFSSMYHLARIHASQAIDRRTQQCIYQGSILRSANYLLLTLQFLRPLQTRKIT